MKWYVIHTRPRQEERALENLTRQGYVAWMPWLEVEKLRGGKITRVVEPMFSRYLFIQLDQVTTNWGPIRSTLGVSKLVTFGNQAASISDEFIQTLQSVPLKDSRHILKPGDQVEITQGPLKGIKGVFEQQDGELRAMILIELINQFHKVQVSIKELRPVNY
jgi:transcriptional antiterminator RfaH